MYIYMYMYAYMSVARAYDKKAAQIHGERIGHS